MSVVYSHGRPVRIDQRAITWQSFGIEDIGNVNYHTGVEGGSPSYYATAYSDSGAGINLAPDAVYACQPAVRTVVSFRARNIAQVPLHSFRMESSGARARVRDTPLAHLLKTPSPGVTSFEFMNTLVHDVDLWDRYAALLTETNETESGWKIERLPPRSWVFHRDKLDRPTRIKNASGDTIGMGEVFWIDNYPTGTKSPMECIRDILIEEGESTAARRDLWKGRARIPGFLTRPADAPPWTPDGRENFRTSWQAYAAGGTKTGRTPLLEDGMAYVSGQMMSSVDAQQIESRKLSRREVAAFWHVPPVMVGDSEASNYSNVVAYREQLYSDTLGTDFQKIQQAFNARVAAVVAPGSDEFAEFAVGEKLHMSFDQQAEIYSKALGTPWKTINEVRREQNLPAIGPDGDKVTIPINVKRPGDNPATETQNG